MTKRRSCKEEAKAEKAPRQAPVKLELPSSLKPKRKRPTTVPVAKEKGEAVRSSSRAKKSGKLKVFNFK